MDDAKTRKAKALLALYAGAISVVISGHSKCTDANQCLPLEDLRLCALAYCLETLRAVAEKRDNATKKPGQADREQVAAVVAELATTLSVLVGERQARNAADQHGATQQPGIA